MKFIIHTDRFPNKNPLGYTRTTQRAKFDPKYRLYEEWKDWVWWNFIQQGGKNMRIQDKAKFFLSIKIFYRNDRRSDPSNVFKGIEDALGDSRSKGPRLYKNDKWTTGEFDYFFDSQNPRVECEILLLND